MVDFQSRDTRRGVSGDDEDEDDEEATEPAGEQEADQDDGQQTESDGESEAADETGGAATDDRAATPEPDADPLAEPGADEATGVATDADDDAPASSGAGAAGSKVAGGRPESSTSDDVTDPTMAVAVVGVGTGDDGTLEAVAGTVESAGHTVATRERLRSDYDGVQQSVDALVSRDDVDAVVTVGGVGITPGQVTVEATHPLFAKALPGFGEAFRSLLFEHIGTGIVADRSTAGIADGTVVFCLPDDPEAARLGVEEIVATEGPRLVDHLSE